MKKRFIALASAASLMLGTSAFAANFKDIDPKDSELKAAIGDLSGLNIINGYEDNTFRGDNLVTRAEMAALCRRLYPSYKIDESVGTTEPKKGFLDLSEDYWGYESLEIMINMQLMQGYEDNTIRPENNVTLSEASAMILRILGYGTQIEEENADAYPNDYLAKAAELGITAGLENVKGDDPLTRSMVTRMLHKALDTPLLMQTGIDFSTGKASYKTMEDVTLRNDIKDYFANAVAE